MTVIPAPPYGPNANPTTDALEELVDWFVEPAVSGGDVYDETNVAPLPNDHQLTNAVKLA